MISGYPLTEELAMDLNYRISMWNYTHYWRLFLQTLEEIQFSGAAVFEIRPRTPLQTVEAAIAFLDQAVS